MLFTIPPNEYKLDESALTGSLLGEDTAYQLSTSHKVNVGTIGNIYQPLNPIAEAVTNTMVAGHFHLLEGVINEATQQLDDEFAYTHDQIVADMDKFNEGVAVFAKSKELVEVETMLDKHCKDAQGFFIDAVAVNQDFAKISNKLEKYFGFGNLAISCTGFDAVTAFMKINEIRGYTKKHRDTLDHLAKNGNAKQQEYVEKARGELNDFVIKHTKRALLNSTSGLGLPNAFTFRKDAISHMQQAFSKLGANIDGSDGRLKWTGNITAYSYIEVQFGLLANRDFDGANTLAIILHEIGHSFYQGSVIARTLSSILSVQTTIAMLFKYVEHYLKTAALSVVARSKVLSMVYNLMYSAIFNIFNVALSIMSMRTSGKIAGLLGPAAGQALDIVLTTANSTLQLLNLVSSSTAKQAIAALTNPMTIARYLSMDGLAEEKFCDNFAAAHGYGPQLTDALGKISGVTPYSEEKNKESFLSQFHAAVAFTNSIVSGIAHFTDTHPSTESRPLFMIDYYNDELKKTTDPKTREYIKGLIVETMKASNIYRVSHKEVKTDLMRHALEGNSPTFNTRTTSLFDMIKNALSLETGSMNNLSTAVMK